MGIIGSAFLGLSRVYGPGGDRIPASGGTSFRVGDYMVHTFTDTGAGTFTSHLPSLEVDILLVGGGGSGANYLHAGGGGGGGVLTQTVTLSNAAYGLYVGAGGATPGSVNGNGNNGEDTYFTGPSTITALGGGAGSANAQNPLSSGIKATGGGRGVDSEGPSPIGDPGWRAGGIGTSPQGFDGGRSKPYWCTTETCSSVVRTGAGGGGGAGAVGGDGVGSTGFDNRYGGQGGVGITNDWTGVSISYGDGGGGASVGNDANLAAVGNGGKGGNDSNNIQATAGVVNTGGGGGGGNIAFAGGSAAGGSGIIVIRYLVA